MNSSPFVIISLLLISYNAVSSKDDYTPTHGPNMCAFRGTCKPAGTSNQPCVDNVPPVPVNDADATAILQSLCPNFYANGNDNPSVCCDAGQIHALKSNMALPAQLLSRCPACYRNFLELWCAYTCDPNQSQFVDVTKAYSYNGSLSADTMDVYFSQDYADSMYESCVGVQFPGGNVAAMSLICGRAVSKCSPQSLLDFLGSKQNGQSPVQLNMHIKNASEPMPTSNH